MLLYIILFLDSSIKEISQPRKARFRSRSRSRSHSSIIEAVSRIRYGSIYPDAIKSRPPGWFWSRSQKVFLSQSKKYYYRAHSSHQQTTTTSPHFDTYYYCTSNDSIPIEIQCTATYGDKQCCDNEKTHEVACCGGQLDDDLINIFNHTTKILSRIFYTLTILALLMRRFYQ